MIRLQKHTTKNHEDKTNRTKPRRSDQSSMFISIRKAGSSPPLNDLSKKENKSADDSPGHPRFFLSYRSALALFRLAAADKSCEAPPSLTQVTLSAASPFCSLTDVGNSVPPKEPPLLRCKALWGRRLATPAQEPDPIKTTLLPSCRLWLSNGCASVHDAAIELSVKRFLS